MKKALSASATIDQGVLHFTVESRLLRELGERLVKQPEIALLELVKNSFDADASLCSIKISSSNGSVRVIDDGSGMTLSQFKRGWMRVGTSAKEALAFSNRYMRLITGEKGIGRFAVRFLGHKLVLESVADDAELGIRTKLEANFDWPTFDRDQDLGKVDVPYRLIQCAPEIPLGTTLTISNLRDGVTGVNLYAVQNGAINVVTPHLSLLKHRPTSRFDASADFKIDPGFSLNIETDVATAPREDDEPDDAQVQTVDVARAVLDRFVLRATVELTGDRLHLRVFRRDVAEPVLEIRDKYPNTIGDVYADIRTYPQRKGTFTEMPVDGRLAKTWVKRNAGIAVFDRNFRVHPYGLESDDWLSMAADVAKRLRSPRSTIAQRHFPMEDAIKTSTQLNYMLKLPYREQVVGVVQVEGRRFNDQSGSSTGLIASADREGFLKNRSFDELVDVVRGAVEALAYQDRELTQELDRLEQEALLQEIKKETEDAVREIESNPNITRQEKARIVKAIVQTQTLAEQHQVISAERQASLEVMSLLGVVAGFMTHEFGVAIHELTKAQQTIAKLAKKDLQFADAAKGLSKSIGTLNDFVAYSSGYISGAAAAPSKAYTARPRVQQVIRVFGQYAEERKIDVEIEIGTDVQAPLIPVSLYNGVALNLFTNALKAVMAKAGNGDRKIAFRAWNANNIHTLEVSDTGIGIPVALRHRIFESLYTTTASNKDPLGSGMGMGLALVKRGVETFKGKVRVIDAPPGYSTCMQVTWPL